MLGTKKIYFYGGRKASWKVILLESYFSEEAAQEWNTVGAAFWDAEEEKKPRSAAADDDDASTATPADLASLPDSLDGRRATLDNDAADRV